MKQTAVEWLILEMNQTGFIFDKIDLMVFEQAKEMEKQQLQLAYASRCSFISCEGNDVEENINCKCGKEYYNETFKKITK
jgi:hypothetical protein